MRFLIAYASMKALELDRKFDLARKALLRARDWRLVTEIGEIETWMPSELMDRDITIINNMDYSVIVHLEEEVDAVAIDNASGSQRQGLFSLRIKLPFWGLGHRQMVFSKIERIEGTRNFRWSRKFSIDF